MSLGMPNLIVALLSLLVGWGALFPARRALGAWGYHLFALPVGLLMWPMGSVVSSLLGATYGPKVVAVASVLFVAAVAGGTWLLLRRDDERPELRWWTWAVWGCGALVVALAVDVAGGPTSGGYDSIFHYQSWAIWLREVGRFTPVMIGAYSLFLPSLHAATLAFGGEWTFVVYPLMSLNLVIILGWAIWRSMPGTLARTWRWVFAVSACLLLVTTTQFAYHAFYAHSHMSSALFLVAAVVAVREAYLGAGAGDTGSARAFGFVAGLSTAALTFVRTDGLAYAVVVLLLMAVLETATADGARRLLAAFSALFGVLAAAYLVMFAQLGFWGGSKMTGRKAAAVIFALAFVAAATPVVVPLARRWFSESRALLGALVATNVVVIVVLWSMNPPRFFLTVTNMVGNLSHKGGWGFVWYFAFGLVVISLALGRAWRAGLWSDALLYAIAQFFFVAIVVHGLAHEGRLAPADSFNGLVFHVLPLILWYWAMFTGGLVETLTVQKRA